MLKIRVKKNKDIIESIKMSGHAEYDEYGKDIVCAAASSILTTSVNAILEFDKNAIKFDDSKGFFLENIKKDAKTNKLLNNMINILKELELEYQKNIKIMEE